MINDDCAESVGGCASRRIDYYDDPVAPKANSLVPSVNAVVTNDVGQIRWPHDSRSTA